MLRVELMAAGGWFVRFARGGSTYYLAITYALPTRTHTRLYDRILCSMDGWMLRTLRSEIRNKPPIEHAKMESWFQWERHG
jgi:hypothetical protein